MLGLKKIAFWIPVAFMLALMWQADRTMRYPSTIGVTKQSCLDQKFSKSITFRQKQYCVTPAQFKDWERLWRETYFLVALFLLSSLIASGVRRMTK